MRLKAIYIVSAILLLCGSAISQQPRPDGPPRGERHHRDWLSALDTDQDGKLGPAEFQTAIDRTFAEFDKNKNGVLEGSEVPHRPMGPPPPGSGPGGRPGQPPMPGGEGRPGFGRDGGPDGPDMSLLPPFFFMDLFHGNSGTISKAEFELAVKNVFGSMDRDRDGVIDWEESRPPHPDDERPGSPPPPNATFIAAELRFGDRLVKDQPFSADTVIEDTRRLFDGSTVTKRIQGSIYRDSAGRTRREQPLEMVGGFNVVGENNQPPRMVFINDFAANVQYFLDLNNKVARQKPIGQMRGPRPEREGPGQGETTESLGKKVIEGVSAEGTRLSFEIPAGQMGNDKPLQVITENWFSPELQLMVMSRHVDPVSGEHIFRLVNIRRSEPPVELFAVPAGFKVEDR